MRVHVLEVETIIPRPLEEVFEFFSRAENLEHITPPSLKFKIRTATPIAMEPGALIEYTIRLMGIPMYWLTEITVWDPPHRFVDNQKEGPYLLWHHEHRFESHPEGTLMRDCVRYAVPGWYLEAMIHRIFVAPRVARIFEYRSETIQRLFA